jgi:hypothetical protein
MYEYLHAHMHAYTRTYVLRRPPCKQQRPTCMSQKARLACESKQLSRSCIRGCTSATKVMACTLDFKLKQRRPLQVMHSRPHASS